MKQPVFSLLCGVLLSIGYPATVLAQQVAKPQKGTAERRLPDDGDGGGPTQPLAPGALFVGEWEWADAGEVFHLTLTRNPAFVPPGYPNDPPSPAVIGQFVYTRNGVVVDQSLTTGRRPYAALGSPVNNRSIEMQFYDHGATRYGYLTLSFQTNNPDVLDWALVEAETWHPTGPFLMPKVMTLTRQ